MRLRPYISVVVGVLMWLGAVTVFAAGTKPAAEVLPRVEYHLRHIDDLAQHFESVLRSPCQHFSTADEWKSYFDGEVDRELVSAKR